MIAAEIYQSVYISVIALLTLFVGYKYTSYEANRVYSGERENIYPSLLLVTIMITFIGLRPISKAFTDMVGYAEAMSTHIFEYVDVRWDNNYLFTPMMAYLSSHNASPQTPILVLAFINIFSTFIAIRKLFPKDTLIALLTVFGSFIYFATATNGIKAGCAMGLLLCAIAYRDKLLISLFFLYLSFGFHHSMQMAIGAYVVCYFVKNSKIYFFIWLFCLICAIGNVTYFQEWFGTMTDESGASYLLTDMEDSNFGGRKGFRLDFVLYSSVPVILGWYALFKKNIKTESYSFILNMYLLLDAIWMLCMYAPYTNRIAEIPWGVLPIALIYPLLRERWGENQYGLARTLIYGNVAFTFFMNFVYYAYIHLDR